MNPTTRQAFDKLVKRLATYHPPSKSAKEQNPPVKNVKGKSTS